MFFIQHVSPEFNFFRAYLSIVTPVNVKTLADTVNVAKKLFTTQYADPNHQSLKDKTGNHV